MNRAITDRFTSRVLLSTGALLLLGGVAAAKHGWYGHGGGPQAGAAGHPCKALLLHAPPMVLKAKLGLDDAQIKKLQGLRDALMGKGIDLRAQAQKQQLALKKLLERDLPQEAAVLEGLRKLRGVRGQLQEERVKAMLQALALLSAPQRAKLRAECPGAGAAMGHGGCPFCGELDEGPGHGPGCGADCGCPQCKGAKGPGCGADCGCPQCQGGKGAGGPAMGGCPHCQGGKGPGGPAGAPKGGPAAAGPGAEAPQHCCGSAGKAPM